MGREGTSSSAERKGRKHPTYIGVRKRKWGMWVSEIRVPNNNKRIWLGSFPKPEMAAWAHDAAVFAFRGLSAKLNFPEFLHSLPHSPSLSARDIQATAMKAARDIQATAMKAAHSKPQETSTNSHNDCMDQEVLQEKPYVEGESIDVETIHTMEMDKWLDSQSLLMDIEDGMLIDSSILNQNESVGEEQEEVFISIWD